MTVETSKKLLSIFGIIDIIFGVLGLILGVVAAAGGGLVAVGGIAAEQADAGAAGGLALLAGIVLILVSVFSVVEGVLSRRAAKDPSKAKPAFVFAVISLVLAAISLISALTGGGSPVSAIISVVINGLLVAAANTQRKEG